jgi:Yip1 domain
MIDRMVRASRFDASLYEEVEPDIDATGQAALVVLIAALASGVGALREGGPLGVAIAVSGGLVGWVLWAAITFWIGRHLFATAATKVTPGQMLRTLGFSHSPGVLNVAGVFPGVGPLITALVGLWVLALGILAIRQAMDFGTGRAIATAITGYFPYALVMTLLAALAISVL